MKKPSSILYRLLYGNKAATICIVFSVATLLDMLLSVSDGIFEISYWQLADRFLLCSLAVLTLSIFKHFEKLPLCIMFLIHFFICISIMLIGAWVNGIFVELHPNAYRDSIRSVVIAYPIIIGGGLLFDVIKTARANRILRKLHHDK